MSARNWMTGEVFEAGDIVTRDGTDRQRVIWAEADMIEVECIRVPSTGWCEIGEREQNIARRYSHPDDTVIDGAAR